MPNDKNDKIRGAHMTRIAHFLGKKGLLAAGDTNRDFREFTEAEFYKRFGLDFLRAIKTGDVKRFNALVSRCPTLISYQFKPEDNPSHTPEDIAAFQNMTAFDLALGQVGAEAAIRGEERESYFGQQLLHHVIRGNQMGVAVLLIRYPQLLSYRGDVVDYSGRMFKNATAFELALWALDVRHMAPAMLKCLTENEEHKDYSRELVPELQKQFDNVVKKDGGVAYTIGCGLLKLSQDPKALLPGKTDEERYAELNRKLNRHDGLIQYDDKLFYFHNLRFPKKLVEITNPDAVKVLATLMNKEKRNLEVDTLQIINHDDELKMIQENVPDSRHIFKEKHYEFKPLIDALDEYFHSFDAGSTWTWEHREAHWCTVVGLAQHYAPAHVAHHYCNPDESFNPKYNNTPPTFDEKVLKRTLNFGNWVSDKTEPWWPAPDVSGSSVLGLDIGIATLRAARSGAWGAAVGESLGPGSMRIDFAALMALCEMRTSDVLELKQLLDSLQKPETGSEPARAGPA